MPSDTLMQAALAATEPARKDFLTAVKAAADEIEGRLRSGRDSGRDSGGRVAKELGSFAAGRIDPRKLAAFSPRATEPHPTVLEALERAAGVMREIALLKEEDFVVEVKAGQRLSRVLADRLAVLGRAFGAAELAALARSGRVASVDADRRLTSYHPDDWSAREREIAPPLVVIADGSTLRLGAVREWMEGNQKIFFVIEGACPPAPMVSLVTPGTWVAQVTDPEAAAEFGSFEGPAACALVPQGAAVFTYDPARGLEASVGSADLKIHGIGPMTVWRQSQDLTTLERMEARGGLSVETSGASNGSGVTGPVEPADRLAAWLLSQTDLPSSD